jgi:hypothetical protein
VQDPACKQTGKNEGFVHGLGAEGNAMARPDVRQRRSMPVRDQPEFNCWRVDDDTRAERLRRSCIAPEKNAPG